MNSYLSIVSEGHGVMRATCHFCHFLALEVRGDQHRGQPLVCRPNPHLTVAIVTPRKQLSVCSNSTQRWHNGSRSESVACVSGQQQDLFENFLQTSWNILCHHKNCHRNWHESELRTKLKNISIKLPWQLKEATGRHLFLKKLRIIEFERSTSTRQDWRWEEQRHMQWVVTD